MKNILILHGSNDSYGASKVLLNIVDCLNEKGCQVHVILPFRGNLDDKLIIKGPLKSGPYRFFIYVRDSNKNVATANIPFYVK